MTMEQTCAVPQKGSFLTPWLIVALGVAAMFVPSFVDFFHGVWSTERNAHGPIVLVVACGYFYVRIRQLLAAGQLEKKPAPLAGGLMLLLGMLCFALGRSQSVLALEAGALVPVLAAVIMTFFGVRTCRRLWFAFFFLMFMIPLPASVVDTLTQPMKIGVSYVTEHLLYALGYPIARNGVILFIGQYQLLVADACAGLNSLFTLEALGLLYMNLVRHQSLTRNTVLALLIVPISFTANTLRVIILTLITFYLGDAAGQGFLHGFAGMVLFLSALGMIMGVDALLTWCVTASARRRGTAVPVRVDSGLLKGGPSWSASKDLFAISARPAVLLLAGMLVASAAAVALRPHTTSAAGWGSLEAAVPQRFGEWVSVPSPYLQVSLLANGGGDGANESDIYDDVLSRTYVNDKGQSVMLALAYAKEQQQDVKIHLPEVCYRAQGFSLQQAQPLTGQAGQSGELSGRNFLARNKDRNEAVSYWVRIGDAVPDGALAARWKIFRDGMKGVIPDGMLVRASSLLPAVDDPRQAYALQEKFMADLVQAVDAGHRGMLLPSR